MNQPYLETVRLIERLHRHFLDVLRVELRRLNIEDINAVQAMLLYNIGAKEVAVRDLKRHGYYLGSNVTYNLKSLTDCGYLEQERSSHDRRSVRLRLTDKGLALSKAITQLQNALSERMGDRGTVSTDLTNTNEILVRLERTWTDFILSGS